MLTSSRTTWLALSAGVVLGLVIVVVAWGLSGPRAGTSPVPASVAPTTAAGPASGSPTAAAWTATSSAPSPAAASASPSAILIAAGDIASCTTDGDEATAKLLDNLPGTIATLGDNVYPDGTARQFRECYGPTWGRHLERTRPSPGNHDYRTRDAAGYFDYFGAAAGEARSGYYAYDLGAWRIYSLNSNCDEVGGCGAGSPQVAWLQADLAANPRQCVLAYWHFPRFSSGRHGSQASVDGLWDTMYAAGAEIVLTGHDHDYERFAPQSDAGTLDPDRGIVEFVAGTGGFSHYDFPRVLATSRVRDNTSAGVLELRLSPGSWSSRFVPIVGKAFTDTAAGTCH